MTPIYGLIITIKIGLCAMLLDVIYSLRILWYLSWPRALQGHHKYNGKTIEFFNLATETTVLKYLYLLTSHVFFTVSFKNTKEHFIYSSNLVIVGAIDPHEES